jgi:catechol 2,3-dioxygenase-like lactoylglutathione lyase family enzyme
MTDRVTANLPARDFDETARFYGMLGFKIGFRDSNWMILSRGPLELEFFPHPEVSPSVSWFSARVRIENVDALYSEWSPLGLSEQGIPRITKPVNETLGFRAFFPIDPNGNLLRCMSPL